jgi:hypothetical protein
MRLSSAAKKAVMDKAKAIIVEKNGKSDLNGISSRFVPIDDKWGVKFTTRGNSYMSETYTRQRRGFRLGIAPFCFGIFEYTCELVGYKGEKFLATFTCYITEIVKVLVNTYGMFYTDDVPSAFVEAIKNLVNMCQEKLGFRFWDYHAQNLGINENGDIIIIDWGDES